MRKLRFAANPFSTRSGEDDAIGFTHGAIESERHASTQLPLGQSEEEVRKKVARTWRLTRFLQNNSANFLVFIFFFITLEAIISCGLTVGLTYFWYRHHENTDDWNGRSMDFVLLGFAVVTPITVILGLAFRRREQGLLEIRRIRASCFQIYLCHGIWDWKGNDVESSGRVSAGFNWLKHTDQVLEQLIGISDELCRFLTLPTSSHSYHRTMSCGRQEARQIVEVGYRLFDSLYTQRLTKITLFTEKLKSLGLSATEASRVRQYERYIGEAIEALRMIKMYRTPQALRAFGRIFTVIIPPFYAPSFAQLAYDLKSLPLALCFATITPFCLTALFESTQALEDPFVGFLSLDGIDVNEEFEVLQWHQLINARKILFPHAEKYDEMFSVPIEKSLPMEIKTQEQRNISGSCRSSHYFATGEGGAGLSSHSRYKHLISSPAQE